MFAPVKLFLKSTELIYHLLAGNQGRAYFWPGIPMGRNIHIYIRWWSSPPRQPLLRRGVVLSHRGRSRKDGDLCHPDGDLAARDATSQMKLVVNQRPCLCKFETEKTCETFSTI